MDRGTLARIDRRLLTEFNHSDGVQLVKVPASDAVWSTWKRYCDAVDVTMGAGIAALMEHELEMVVGDGPGDAVVLVEALADRSDRLERRVVDLEGELASRERELTLTGQRLEDLERRLRAERSRLVWSGDILKVGRNDSCPCGSGVKYKRCHGG